MGYSRREIYAEIDGLRDKVEMFPDIKMRAAGMLLHADMLEWLIKKIERLEKKLAAPAGAGKGVE